MAKQALPGLLEVVHGSMFGGKTEYMIARLREEQARGRRVRAFKHMIDDRYDPDHLVTHRQDRFVATRVGAAEELLSESEGYEVVAIDEGHFFTPALVEVVRAIRERCLVVIVAGITHDAWGRQFTPIPELARMADREILRQAPCSICGEPSPFTQRMTPVKSAHMVGGLGDYEPRCALHFEPLTEAARHAPGRG